MIPTARIRGDKTMEYRIEDLTKEEATYIGEKINEIVPREVDADEEKYACLSGDGSYRLL